MSGFSQILGAPRFSEFEGTPFFNSKLPHDKVLAVQEHLAEGCGIRQTARLVGVKTYLTLYSDHFCWRVRTLRIKDEQGRWQERLPPGASVEAR